MSTSTAPQQAPATGDSAGVRLDGVSFAHPAQRRRLAPVAVLDDVTLTIAAGEFVAVVGPSGCGKSTLLELVCGLLSADRGTLRGDDAVLMPQRDQLLPWLDALDNAALALRIQGASRAQARASALPLMQELGLGGFERARPYELSGGMRQRVAFLRTLLSGKPVLCLDEPFASLDAITRAEMRDWLTSALAAQPRTTLLVTHDVEDACVLADRVVVMSPRPARIRAILEIGTPRPRRPTDLAIVAVRERALEVLAA